jgi:hypothetical protein
VSGAWSRLDYKDYFGVQEWIRQRFPDAAPLAVEFHLWQALGAAKKDSNPYVHMANLPDLC